MTSDWRIGWRPRPSRWQGRTHDGGHEQPDGRLPRRCLERKLPYLPAWTEARRTVAARYDELLTGLSNVSTPRSDPIATMFIIFTLFARKSAKLCEASHRCRHRHGSQLPESPAFLSRLRLPGSRRRGFSCRPREPVPNLVDTDLPRNHRRDYPVFADQIAIFEKLALRSLTSV